MSFYGQVSHNLLLLEIWPQDKELEDPWKCKDFVYKIASFLYVFKELGIIPILLLLHVSTNKGS